MKTLQLLRLGLLLAWLDALLLAAPQILEEVVLRRRKLELLPLSML